MIEEARDPRRRVVRVAQAQALVGKGRPDLLRQPGIVGRQPQRMPQHRPRQHQASRGQGVRRNHRARPEQRRRDDPVRFQRQRAGDAEPRVAEFDAVARFEVQPRDDRGIEQDAKASVSRRQRGCQRLRRIDPGGANQRPAGIDRFQFHQLPLPGRGDHDRAHLGDLRDRRGARFEPRQKRGGEGIGSRIDLQVAAEDTAAIVRHAGIDGRPQPANRGDRRDTDCQAQHHTAQAAHAAAKLPAREPPGEGQVHAWFT